MKGDPTGAGPLAKAKGAASEGFELNLLRTLRPKRTGFRLERANFRPERADTRPERADFRPERAWGKQTNGRTKERTNESPLYSTGLRPLWGCCPKRK